jgi:glycosyltransferase involved in cell wall biosynthesis/2-polyprenyl-3-methyl-5-hydroxy-6-metoxy-1,4-benzoquinol methylase
MIEVPSSKRYSSSLIDLDNKNNGHTLAIDFIGENKRVLEVGTSTGYVSKILNEKGNTVIGIEIDVEAAEIASQICETMITGDIENIDLDNYLEPSYFDVILCGDILEHLKYPGKVLVNLHKYLKPDGFLVVSLPNVCHGDVLLSLMHGDFQYTKVGLLDETHLRFFGLKNIIKLFDDCGYSIIDLKTTNQPVCATELSINKSEIPELLLKFIEGIPNTSVYQYVFKAVPSGNQSTSLNYEAGIKSLFDGLLDEIIEINNEQLTQKLSFVNERLEQEKEKFQKLTQQILEKENKIAEIVQYIAQTESHIALKEQQITQTEQQVAEMMQQIAHAEQQIAEIKESISFRFTTKLDEKVINRVFPAASNKRKIYDLGLKGGRTLVNEGFRPTLWKFKEYRRKSKNRIPIGKNINLNRSEEPADILFEDNGEYKGQQYVHRSFDKQNPGISEYVALSEKTVDLTADDLKLIAFYLPQFHPIPENDAWWGRGFTEWTNVSKAVPQFIGHYQPHLPGELGFYDLRLIEVQKRQIELAKRYGIYGFCFHYYWFSGKRLLEKPLNQFLHHPELDIPFCLCWANENWTRRWDGLENEVLISQEHSSENDFAFIKDLEDIFKDPRYIRVNGKPLLIVYRALLLPHPKETAERWRRYCKEKGIGDIYLVAAQGFGFEDPRKIGFDAAVEFPPHTMHNCANITDKVQFFDPNFSGNVFDYEGFVNSKSYLKTCPYKLLKTVSPGWDNTARKMNSGSIFYGATPGIYKEWLSNVANFTMQTCNKEERMVFINAWNEWAEGAHLEPDRKYGYGYLQATADAIIESRTSRVTENNKKIIFVSHDAHYHGAQLLSLNIIKHLKEQFHYEVILLLKSGGRLEGEFKKYATVYNIEQEYNNEKALITLIDHLRENGAAVSICNTVVSGDIAAKLTGRGIRVICLIHELPELIKAYRMESNAQDIALLADKVIFPSMFVREKFESIAHVDEGKSVIRPQGLYLRNRYKGKKEKAKEKISALLSIPPHSKIILGVGYADFRKGVDLFVNVANNVVEMESDTYFVWVGHQDSHIMGPIIEDINKRGLDDRILFPGIIEDVEAFYAGSDLYLLTSREDPFPSTVMEAMDIGVPVIGFEGAGGFSDIVTDQTGVLVPYLDIEKMSDNVIKLLSDHSLREQLGNNASTLISEKYQFVDYIYDLLEMLGHEYRKVSVVVPNYNYAHFMQKRLHTITKQDYPIYEIIFLDDFSSDNSVEIAKNLLHSNLIPSTIAVNNENSGSVSRQWTKGIEMAKGDYIWIAEADDLSESRFLTEVMKGFSDNEVVLSYTQSKQMDQKENLLASDYLAYTKDIDSEKWKSDYTREGLLEIRDTLVIKNTIPNVSAVVFKKFNTSEIIDEMVQYKVAGDWRFYVWILQKGKISYCARSMNLHRRHTGGVTISENAQLHFDEITRMQEFVMSRFNVDSTVKAKALDYREKVKEYLLGKQPAFQRLKKEEEIKEVKLPSLKISDEEWLKLLVDPKDGLPALPPEDIQVRFCGRSGQLAIEQAMEFYKVIREASKNSGKSLEDMTAILDFGCGWGRIFRCFLREAHPGVLRGCDVMPEMIQLCKSLINDYEFIQNKSLPPTSFNENTFDLIYAYSVFSHLSEEAHKLWLQEFHRIMKPGGILVLTTRPREFIDYWPKLPYIKNLDVKGAMDEYDTGKFVYIPTGGGDNLDESFYGEAAISEQYIKENWSQLYNVEKFLDGVPHVDQKIIIMKKKLDN